MADPNQPQTDVVAGTTVIDIRQNGMPFLTYNFAGGGLFKPFLHPVMGPNHWPITQNGEFPGTLRGQYWHRGIFIGHQKVSHKTDRGSTTTSFWEEKDDCGRIVHEAFEPMKSGQLAVIAETLVWKAPGGRDLLRETRTISVPAAKTDERIIDVEIRLKVARDAVRFEQTPYNLLAVRAASALSRLQEKEEYTKKYGTLVDFRPLLRGGKVVNAEGKENEAARGERSKWLDFSGPIDNEATGGIAILDHPMNPRHPTYWGIWNHQTISAAFTYAEHFELTFEKELRLKYRLFIHRGSAKEADVEGAWVDFGHRD
jgi:hypothetical protein